MADSNQLRERAEQLLTLARNAREDGQIKFADHLTRLAAGSYNQALKVEKQQTRSKKALGHLGWRSR
jgi:hypothetical protein